MSPNPNPTAILSTQNVSRGTLDKLEHYRTMLIKWQKAVNLVSNKSLPDAWQRHFEDSAQLLPHIPDTAKTLVDIGSGAGFPGLVLAILRPDIKVHLVESDQKKCQFLKNVSRETQASCAVHPSRIETMHDALSPDLITARALASLTQLFEYCTPWAQKNPRLTLLLLKGLKSSEEITEAQKTYRFDCTKYPSQTDENARILKITNLQKIS